MKDFAGFGRRIPRVWFLCALTSLLVGCASPRPLGVTISYRESVGDDRVSVFHFSINGNEYEHRSPTGFVQVFENRKGRLVKIDVSSEDSIGTYVGGEIGHFYYVGDNGQITYLGSLKESWYEGENVIRAEMGGFVPVIVPH